MNVYDYVVKKARKANAAARVMSGKDTAEKNKALLSMAREIRKNKYDILKANELDLENAKKLGKSSAFIDRLSLNEKRIDSMAEGLEKVASLPDPIGEGVKMWKRPNDLRIEKVRVPLGTIGIIYEARPNVTVDASALCLKSGNSVVLRGGKEAICSNLAIYNIIYKAAVNSGLPEGAVEFIDITEREAVEVLMKLNGYIDVLIPRGGRGLISSVVKNSTVPVIETGSGNCHIYVDADADLDMAEKIVVNAKTQRPAVCNAMETLLVHKDAAGEFLPRLGSTLHKLNVEIRGCSRTQKLIPDVKLATERDYSKEFLDLILAVKVVDSMDEAIDHIYKYGTGHSEAIITNNYASSQKFLREIDAAVVYVNASTRFTDGGEFGFGSEIGISTQKLHARGPMGLNELTTTKYMVYGNGQIRE
ncbi:MULTISPECIES: glutamate-5-semialdehyde dehydrogenase [Clostridium]|jgi:glutamate-5-semialdehyde dehydrogenase|uniref:Gamma-glutamyl phosphate reductase n=1 Tax=Clostridium lapidicellarium TaxID=3240931 RepID=A0ABV4DZU9_9CLOT|nr:glutamate-5-semialdehyde dehydrogenase [uncultured Clostridium sp.]NLU07557.1 glutamate-5-semialdehyde dehydrogenase [Clostridiales bacterium]